MNETRWRRDSSNSPHIFGRAGPNVFKLLINDLRFSLPYIKYVDDVSVVASSADPLDTSLHRAVNEVAAWCEANGMFLNVTKTKEMVIYFGKATQKKSIPPIQLQAAAVERVEIFKLLGVIISSDLSWQSHVDYIVKRASKRFFVLCQLVRIGVSVNDVTSVYCSLIRSILEYACPVWHCGLTKGQSEEIEGVQRRCMRILFPELSYSDSLQITGLELLCTRRERLVYSLFSEIKNKGHVLNNLLPAKIIDECSYTTRDSYPYRMPRARTERPLRSFISYCVRKRF